MSIWATGCTLNITFVYGADLSGWTVQLALSDTITVHNLWRGTVTSPTDSVSTITVESKSWNANRAAYRGTSFGTVVYYPRGGACPTATTASINGAVAEITSVGFPTAPPDVAPSAVINWTITNAWGTGCIVEVLSSLNGPTTSWTATLVLSHSDITVVNNWNSIITSTSANVLSVSNAAHNGLRAADQTASYGFQLQHGNGNTCPLLTSGSVSGVSATIIGDVVVLP